jgi:hypothetical protein
VKRFTFDDIEKPEERGDSLRYELWGGDSAEGVTSWSVHLLTAY